MSERNQLFISRLLEYLESLEGGLALETILQAHVGLNAEPRLTLAEFNDLVKLCEANRWITSIRTDFGNLKWGITERGRKARTEI